MTPHDEKQLQKLLTSLNHRLSPTVFLVIGNTEALRQRLQQRVEAESTNYKHIIIDMEPHAVYSLRDAIARFVPDEVKTSKPLEYVVHFTGLSASLWETKDGQLRHTRLLEELNFERERLFHDYPFISFIWETPYFYKEFFFKAGDLMSWLVDRYEFVEDDAHERVAAIPDKEPLDHRGADPKRLQQIERLKYLLERLDEEGSDTRQYITEKTDTLLTLGVEYTKAFQWNDAHRCLLKAQRLVEQHYSGAYREVQVYYYLGDLALAVHNLPEALVLYQGALISEQMRRPDSGNIGRIYHQIGFVHQEQRRWDEALNSYQKALKLKEQAGDRLEMSSTHHHIGMVYQEQRRWHEALYSYQRALEVQEQTGIRFNMGGTHHQIGMVYQEQGRWDEALDSYQKALEVHEQTGNRFEMGSTYHQIGRVYEEQLIYRQAKDFFQKAVNNLREFQHPALPTAEASLAHVQAKLNEQP